MCIPRGGPNPDNAHTFINFILDAEVHGAIAEYVQYPCPNAAALEYIPEADRENRALYPPREVLDRCEVAIYKGEEIESLYSDALTRVLAA
jgi:spermidine/putrescine transport system substrate-binding protein